jgi:hypothetical protein
LAEPAFFDANEYSSWLREIKTLESPRRPLVIILRKRIIFLQGIGSGLILLKGKGEVRAA